MNIYVIAVGKIKEKFFRDAVEEYKKRLSRYCKLEIIEVPDEKTPDNASEKEEEMIKEKEGQKILKHISDKMFVITLEIDAKQPSSEELAAKIKELSIKGESNIAFVIGGSLGLAKSVQQRANHKMSFSRLTFPHQLFRVMVLEQIYRGYRIISGEPYHK
ncbi:Ribosomal RNA large subunit methyltransferase H [Clostridium sp. N3C]|uniref:23S rRNA (pseudouridine(1915)-N(3))-methyltransferase RlmH n=1 Tax=Clostridium sp. N3C TaxID=1776758 RepID=UPI00092E16A7|nr:23S rRNA (pseudouridine(1915)-N(3))-methyltransferase RlmH [Clostridium sp. N3C]SCN25758.1 Ribosomal RNA large subunit methyltransferase H [Clostridium sp. N3C]